MKARPVKKVQRQAKLYKGDVSPDDWVVWVLGDDGDIVTTVFAGYDAEDRALEYATSKYDSVERLRDHEKPPLRLVVNNIHP